MISNVISMAYNKDFFMIAILVKRIATQQYNNLLV